MLKQYKIHRHKKTHEAGGLDCKVDSTGELSKVNYSLYRFIFKPVLILLLAVAYVPIYCSFMLALLLLPASLSNRLVDWLAVEQEGA